eukprot:NODE_876_length_3362_cov_0.997242.p3 type:complete len:242 gc:universal NODE_876_length_3362_cov_0.997242:2228-1503(-)
MNKIPREIKVLIAVYSGSIAYLKLYNLSLDDIPKDQLYDFYMNKNNHCPTTSLYDAMHYDGITINLLKRFDKCFQDKVEYHNEMNIPLECLCSHQGFGRGTQKDQIKLHYKMQVPKWCLKKSNAIEWLKVMFERGSPAFPGHIIDAIKYGNLDLVKLLLKRLVISPHDNMFFEASIRAKQVSILGFFIDYFDASTNVIQFCISICNELKVKELDPLYDEMLIMLNVAAKTPIDNEQVKVDL